MGGHRRPGGFRQRAVLDGMFHVKRHGAVSLPMDLTLTSPAKPLASRQMHQEVG